jgi:mannitol PTS system EIICBA or EIICB component
VGPASPGSILAYFAMAPKGGLISVLAGVLVATVVSFAVAALLLRTGKQTEEEPNLEEASAKMREMKTGGMNDQVAPASAAVANLDKENVNKIVFACDAGMGSSAMGASVLRKKLQQAGVDITVVNSAVSEIPDDADIVITQKTLTERAIAKNPNAEHISIDNFLKSPRYDELVERLKD